MTSKLDLSDGDTRDEILHHLELGINRLAREIEETSPESSEEEELQLRRHREMGYLANQFRKLQRDADLDEMAEELEILKEERDLED